MQQNINIPKRLARKYFGTGKKSDAELFCFAVWVKTQRENSVVFGMNHKQVRYRCKVGKKKAIRLLQDAAEDKELFTVDGETIKVHSFRDKTAKTNRKKQEYFSDQCFKLKYRNDYTLREIYEILMEFLVLDPIVTHERKDCFISSDSTPSGAALPMTLKKVSENIGMSISTARRVIQRLKTKGVITVISAITFSCPIYYANEVAEVFRITGKREFTYIHHGIGYVVKQPCSYSIVNREVLDKFQHVIYNYVPKSHSFKQVSTIPQLNDW